jgi:short-subunit dehydrogenase
MHVAITGASSGIGEALARAWAKRGAKLTLVARRGELLEKLAAELGGGPLCVARDLAVAETATHWLAEAEAKHGPIDVLVNNAGMENVGKAVNSDPAVGLKLLQLNLITPLLLTRAVLPGMIARKSGSIVQVSSIAGLVAAPGMTWYGASKAGLAQFTETLRAELAGTGVHSCVVYPGPIKTPFGDVAFEKLGGRQGAAGTVPEGSPERLAELVLRAVDKRQRRVLYPTFYALAYYLPSLARFVTFRIAPRPKS